MRLHISPRHPGVIVCAISAVLTASCASLEADRDTAIYEQAKADYLAGRYGPAADKASAYLNASSSGGLALEARRLRAQSRFNQGQPETAAADFKAILDAAKSPQLCAYAALGLGHVHFVQGRYEQASQCYQQADRLDRTDGRGQWLEKVRDELLFAWGVSLQNTGHWKEAHAKLQELGQRYPNSKWASAAGRRASQHSFVIQLGAYTVRDRAQQQYETARSRGLDARIVERRDPAGRTLYAVVTGRFLNLHEATKAKAAVASRLGVKPDAIAVTGQ